MIEKITQNIYQEFNKERKKNISSKYIKVGFVSCFFKNHTVSKLFKNWILKLDQKYFKRFVYYAGNEFDDTTNEIKQNVDYFFNDTDVDQLINQIFNLNNDLTGITSITSDASNGNLTLATNGTVLLLLGLTSKQYNSSPCIANWILKHP